MLTLTADIADLKAYEQLVAARVKRFGGINVLVNNAGLRHRGELSQRSPEQIAAMVDVNL
ncbi:SDR family NAD(P)-dependent oxidoreductase [Shewanella sp.]|uniref:SDR family NAD(P)-dependent oxidoreductase n=1 Tax=Shewanella sp. TaxID=50422 RepID=UPI0025E19BA1|nr:SDR family NAD(P)-dependent oxidoreductase [Shewanella sp.]